MTKHVPEHEAICGSELAEEKRGEGEIIAEPQPSRASCCETATSSRE
jgi:hypothetical protein